jgi:antirestriction protein ArdC
MPQTENVRRVAEQILEAFQAGTVPAACAQIFLRHTPDDSRPCARWSWRNQLLAALLGHHDARGFRQWQEVGRHVRKGERAFYILAPSLRRAEPKDDEPQDEPEFVVTGFVCVPVFGYSQTEGDPLPGAEEEAAFLSALPLVEVARSWGLHVGTFAAEGTGRLGYYRPGEAIAVGVENLSTWTHELLHAADDRRGTLVRARGQKLSNEVVAEFGGAILLECLGYSVESDRGGAYAYIESYCREHEADLLTTCTDLLDRACAAVALLLDTAQELSAPVVSAA